MNKHIKVATADHPIHDLIVERWSPRAFADRPVEREKLQALFEAARWAASSGNGQPWRYILATKEQPEAFNKMLGCLMEGNVAWAQSAPVLMISVAQIVRENGRPNRHGFHDLGAATATLSIQALALDLYVHQMGGFFVDKARELYQIPEDFEAVAAIALGYLGDPDALAENHRERELQPRDRMSISEFVFENQFGQPSPSTA